MAVIRDITDRRVLEQNLSSVLEAAPDGVAMVDREGHIVLTNTEMENIFGYTKTEMMGAKVEMLMPPKYRDIHVKHRVKYASEPSRRKMMSAGMPLIGQHKDGRIMDVDVSLSPVKIDLMTHTIAIVRDVTMQKQYEQELLKAREEAVAASNAKSAFVANMSHEIRTPMHGVIGWADILSEKLVDEEQKQCLSNLQQSASSLMTIINDILDVSKMDSGKFELNVGAFDLHDLINTVHNIATVLARGKPVQVCKEVDLPTPFVIMGDFERLRQVILNLVSNAIKFTERGSVRITYAVEAPCLVITVEDTGIGIAESDSELIFQVFTQLDHSNDRKYGGTGLGLAIARNLVELMNGSLSYKSTPLTGSSFRCCIPLSRGELVVKRPELHAAKLRGSVLLVDDNRINLAIASKMAISLGLKVHTARDGLEAIAFFEDGEKVDVVLMDIQMPKLDGLQATQQLRQAGLTVPIIAISASALDADVQNSMNSGMNDHLSKPFDMLALKAMLLRWLPQVT
ncbi:histidine kinase-like ATPase [Tribonema minus]|uniref:histidine kinase n=1 Tax=Tribonema minus TaxID=303371 RepID=A0A835Z4B0_9STRA|nr:histidine kinase-like ATPase [Tribonema minus]